LRLQGLTDAFAHAGVADGISPFVNTEIPIAPAGIPPSSPADERRTLDTVYRTIRGFLRRNRSAAPATFHRYIIAEVFEYLGWWDGYTSQREQVGPLFTRAISDKSITAWVCATDFLAGFAVDFLAGNKIEIPKRISLVAFDNQTIATTFYISSYDFGVPQIIRNAVRFIIDPKQFRNQDAGDTESEGLIVERSSIAKAGNH